MTVFYVSNTGSDGNGGTSESDAKATIQNALDTLMSDGDTLMVLSDTTNIAFRENIVIDGFDDIRIVGAPKDTYPKISPCENTLASIWTETSGGSGVFKVTSADFTNDLDDNPLVVFDFDLTGLSPDRKTTYISAGANEAATVALLQAAGSGGVFSWLASTKTLYYRPILTIDNNDLQVPTNATGELSAAFIIRNSDRVVLENLGIRDYGPYAIIVEDTCTGVQLNSIDLLYGISKGIVLNGTRCIVDRCSVVQNEPQVGNSALGNPVRISGVNPAAIYLNNTKDCVVRNCLVDKFARAGIEVAATLEKSDGSTVGLYGNNFIVNNVVRNQKAGTTVIVSGVDDNPYAGGAFMASIRGSDANLQNYWRDNAAYKCNDTGVYFQNTRLNVFSNTTVAFCSRGVYFSVSEDNVFINSIVYESGTIAAALYAIQIQDQSWSALDPDNQGYHQVEVGIDFDVLVDSIEIIGGQKSNILGSNLYYRTGSEDSVFQLGKSLFTQNDWPAVCRDNMANGGDRDLIHDDPDFVDDSTDDYRLLSSSPAIDVGRSLIWYSDLLQNMGETFTNRISWGSAPDLGAYEAPQAPMYPLKDIQVLMTEHVVQKDSDQLILDRSTSIGGIASNTLTSGSLFSAVDGSEIPASGSFDRYRSIKIKNVAMRPVFTSANATNLHAEEGALDNVSVWISLQAPTTPLGLDSTEFAVSWENNAPFNAAQPNDETDPSGADIAFTSPLTAGTAVPIPANGVNPATGTGPKLEPILTTQVGQAARLWLRRRTYSTAEPRPGVLVKIRIQGDSTSG
jgi:hypothetical protein